MNYYIVVEGHRTEKRVFSHWIPFLNPGLTQVEFPAELDENNFVLVSGHGYPNYLNVVKNAATDVTRNPKYGTLVVSVDAEDDDPQTVRDEVLNVVHEVNQNLVPEIVVQNACIESWFLGNRRMIRRLPRTPQGRDWRRFYDVWNDCPEELPPRRQHNLNRAQTALKYFVTAIQDNATHLRYSKSRPEIVCNEPYLQELVTRATDTGHIPSFTQLVRIF